MEGDRSWRSGVACMFPCCCSDSTATATPPRCPSQAPRVLHFGAGNIGRGFIGKLCADAGCCVILADVVPSIINELSERKKFTVRVVGESERLETVEIAGAIFSNSDAAIDEIVSADVVTTAVGPRILERIAPTLLKGLYKRRNAGVHAPLNFVACENLIGASSHLREYVVKACGDDQDMLQWMEKHVGFVNCAVDRIVPPPDAAANAHDDPLLVTVEEFCEWIVDENGFCKAADTGKPIIPRIEGMVVSNNLLAFNERKLFTVNTGHAICAYLGWTYRHAEIRGAILDKRIRPIVEGAMHEAGAVLCRRFAFDVAAHNTYINKILKRYENPYLRDEVVRVGRDPQRKLASTDRLVKPLMGTIEYGLEHSNLVVGISAALLFDFDQDPQAVAVQEVVRLEGYPAALKKFSDLDQPEIVKEICDVISHFKELQQAVCATA